MTSPACRRAICLTSAKPSPVPFAPHLSGNPVESRKQPLTRLCGDDWSTIRHIEHSLTVLASDGHLNGWLAMQLGIFDEVADHSTQQHRISAHHDRLSFDAAIVVTRAFLGRERGQVNFLTNIQLLGRVEAAGEKYFVHELVELGDISLKLQFAFGRSPRRAQDRALCGLTASATHATHWRAAFCERRRGFRCGRRPD